MNNRQPAPKWFKVLRGEEPMPSARELTRPAMKVLGIALFAVGGIILGLLVLGLLVGPSR